MLTFELFLGPVYIYLKIFFQNNMQNDFQCITFGWSKLHSKDQIKAFKMKDFFTFDSWGKQKKI